MGFSVMLWGAEKRGACRILVPLQYMINLSFKKVLKHSAVPCVFLQFQNSLMHILFTDARKPVHHLHTAPTIVEQIVMCPAERR